MDSEDKRADEWDEMTVKTFDFAAKAKERFEKAKERYRMTKEIAHERRDKLKEAREEYIECKNSDTEECAGAVKKTEVARYPYCATTGRYRCGRLLSRGPGNRQG